MFQHTLSSDVSFEGVGIHGGAVSTLVLSPAPPRSGIVFRVAVDGTTQHVPATSAHSVRQDLATVLVGPDGARVSTVEHVMAALAGCGVDNALVDLDGGEPPIMDGGSSVFVAGIRDAGIVVQAARRRVLRVLKTVRVEHGASWAEYRPHDGTRHEVSIDFAHPAIGRQTFAFELGRDDFGSELAPARTFGFVKDVDRLRAAGMARGASLANTVVLDDDGSVVNPEGLRFVDEFVRHKTLDSIGDQALAGARVLGCFSSHRGGHSLNAAALEALLSDASAYRIEDAPRRISGGAGLPIGAVAGTV